ncbi:MAG: VOC family protein [Anaerolineae bacterium]|nr:VOC family protein [Anaerolineae bacterium]
MKIDPQLTMGKVVLTVSNLNRSVDFYQRHIGLKLLSAENDQVTLGAGDTALLQLHALPGGRYAPHTTGLYHFALLVPSRLALAQSLRHFLDAETALQGAADHFVSEALYLSDPDGHGIEIYRDRPRAAWRNAQGEFTLTTEPFDAQGVLDAWQEAGEPAWQGLHPETCMGHVHLRVADLDATERFYTDVLGFERMAVYPGARFISAGGYHHHIGMNVWAGQHVKPATEADLRLLSYEVVLSSQEALAAVIGRIDAANQPRHAVENGWIVHDPAQIPILLTTRHAH